MSLVLVASSTYYRVSQSVTLEQLEKSSRLNRALTKQVIRQINRVVGATAGPWRVDTTVRLDRSEARELEQSERLARIERLVGALAGGRDLELARDDILGCLEDLPHTPRTHTRGEP